MSIDATVPTDSELLSTYAEYIRETREAINDVEEAVAEELVPPITVAANADTSPSVDGALVLLTANTGATLITFFDDGYAGQLVALLAGDAYTTVQHDAGLIQLVSGANVKLRSGEALLFTLGSDGVWHEVGGYKRLSTKIVTAPTYSVAVGDVAVIGNAPSGDQSFTLPLAASVSEGHTIHIKKLSAHAGVVTTVRQGSDYIDNGTDYDLTLEGECVTFSSDGVSVWYRFN